jgi:hypothetical protein
MEPENPAYWSKQQVNEWLNRAQIHYAIKANICECDGRALRQMQALMQRAPDFFFKSISTHSFSGILVEAPFYEVLKFMTEFQNIGFSLYTMIHSLPN